MFQHSQKLIVDIMIRISRLNKRNDMNCFLFKIFGSTILTDTFFTPMGVTSELLQMAQTNRDAFSNHTSKRFVPSKILPFIYVEV